ncbi:YdcF family protein [Pseudoalteromonas ruthenica]|uniref:YdcF family protein n=1 Tax=Pseudoalteromonas ruthenica TaxID=151081 RepID=UPI001108CF53|nr:YdcF family protein [Pseudoalteromonas ruthenica]TLX51046.1 YdcF family protein [Pseudoalteromonas ruthenica]
MVKSKNSAQSADGGLSYAVVVVLGAPNDRFGQLSDIARARGEYAAKLYHRLSSQGQTHVLCTGGFGEHFNQSPWPHSALQQQHLITQGVERKALLAPTMSRFTFEDALLSQPVLASHAKARLHIVTSGFHLARVASIFDALYSQYRRTYHGCKTPVSASQYQALLVHERKVMARELCNIAAWRAGN